MKVLVFAKQIPEISKVTFDPETNRIVRENVPLVFNSFDKKAVEEAIRIKEKHGWETAVASMGPPQAKDILNYSLRMGVDRAFLITDRMFAGADTLVTSRILSKLVGELKPDLVLMGKYSLDGETSQVPPEVAVLSGYNFKSSVSRISIEENGKQCTVEQESENGLSQYRINLPAVLSVSEKINRARAVSEETPDMLGKVETLDSASLKVDIIGTRDSPTVVTGTERIESDRKVEMLEFNDDLFGRLLEIIQRETGKTSGERRITIDEYNDDRECIWGIALEDPQVSREIATRVSELAAGNNMNSVMVGNVDPDRLHGMPCHRYIRIDAEESDVLAKELTALIDRDQPRHVVFPSTVTGREVSAMIAATLGLGLTADCIDVEIRNGELVQYKPAFGGGIVASIVSKTKPGMATARPGMFLARECDYRFVVEDVKATYRSRNEKISHEDVSSDYRPLNDSETVIGVGRGLKSRSMMTQVLQLAEKLDASVGGTRPVVDMRWMPRQQQIGLTGFSISPDTYISLGVSGQDNHVVGIRYAGKVIAVNTDSEAPVFRYADYGIVADAAEFISRFTSFLESR